MILWMMRILAIDIRLKTYLVAWDRLPIQFLLALGPFIYFYVLKTTRPEYKFRWMDLLHFSPVLLEQGVLALEVRESVRTGAATYTTWTFQLLNPVLQLLIFISIITYLYRSRVLIQNFYRRFQPILMDRPRLEFRWLSRLLTATALLWLLWIAYAAVDYFGYRSQSGFRVHYLLYIYFAVIILWTAIAAFLRSQAVRMVQPPAIPKPSASAELGAKGARVKKAMEANRYYQDPELSLSSLAKKLGLQPHELSRIINLGLKKNFNDFINEYRVREATRKMRDPAYSRLSLLGIAYDSGFNSKSTFSRTFKQMIGKSPVHYKNDLKKERPDYNLSPQSRPAGLISTRQTTSGWSFGTLNRIYMFRNYLKIAWRNMLYNKGYSALNIFGLATGMAVAILIGLWVADQYAYDRFLPDYEQLYQVEMNLTSQYSGETTQTSLALPLVDVLRNEIPGIKYAAESDNIGKMDHDLLVDDKKLYLAGGAAGPEFFKIFQYPFIEGDANLALKDIYSIVLTQSTARALFGDANPMGEYVRFDNSQNMKVTGIIKDIPKNATLQFNYLTPFAFMEATQDWIKVGRTKWTYNSFSAYVALGPGVTCAQIAPKIR